LSVTDMLSPIQNYRNTESKRHLYFCRSAFMRDGFAAKAAPTTKSQVYVIV
jgi:hypothetical protein